MMPADYIYKLWLAHGVTSVRKAGCMNGLAWASEQRDAAESHRIAAPRLHPYVFFPAVNDWLKTIYRLEEGREWLRKVRDKGAEGVKFFGAPAAIMQAALDECMKLGLANLLPPCATFSGTDECTENCAMGVDQHRAFARSSRGAFRRPHAARL